MRIPATFLLLTVFTAMVFAEDKDAVQKAKTLINQGLHKDALDILTASDDAKSIPPGVECLLRLNRIGEIDAYLTAKIAKGANDALVLAAAAKAYRNLPSSGKLVDNTFIRGEGKLNSQARDRVRALQLYRQAANTASLDTDFYLEFAETIRIHRNAWELQALTDLTVLPDYEQGYRGRRYWGGNNNGSAAPVDEHNNPVVYLPPKSFDEAKNDGERWRWCLEQASKGNNQISLLRRAEFYQSQFGVETLRFGFSPRNAGDDNAQNILSLETLADDETLTKLATGVKRFKMPAEGDYIALYKQIEGPHGAVLLANEYKNRRQYVKAAEQYRKALDLVANKSGEGIDRYDAGSLTKELNQIVGNWGRLESAGSKVAGLNAELRYVFRNGKKVHLTATEVNVEALLNDVKTYLKSEPKELEWEKIYIQNIGSRLVQKQETKYLGKVVKQWSVDLTPAEKHFDTAITLQFKSKAGAYLMKAAMDGGNTEYALIWLDDTAIVKKQLNGQTLYFVADAETGKPKTNVPVEFFGYKNEYKRIPSANGRERRDTQLSWLFDERKITTDQNGLIRLQNTAVPQDFNWLIRTPGNAFIGFDHIWFGNYNEERYNVVKIFPITDRPVYRPKDTVRFKAWVGIASYDEQYIRRNAQDNARYIIRNPKGETVVEKTNVRLDAYGGFADEIVLDKNCPLGTYSIWISSQIDGRDSGTYAHFRVEEYRKPEYEVVVDAPHEPVKLGDKIQAKISAKYYFGSPVSEATVKYKVLRQKHNTAWYPLCRWDWLYGNGYGWLSYDMGWLPGWKSWGCCRPLPPWFPWDHTPPEIVAEVETKISPDGTVNVEIDTAIAQALFPDDDQQYTITAEVVDASRTTIVGEGKVLVSKVPFKVYAWSNCGYYHTGDKIVAEFQARRLDGKPVSGEGAVFVEKITSSPISTDKNIKATQTLKFDTDGKAAFTFNAAEAGQFKVSCKLNGQEGGAVFNVYGQKTEHTDYRYNKLELIPDKQEYAPKDTVRLRVNTDRSDSTVLLFIKQEHQQILTLTGKSSVVDIPVALNDMPNFYIEAVTVTGGEVVSETKEICVPPQKRVLNVDIKPTDKNYKPGAKAQAEIVVTDTTGEPVAGQITVAIYDKSVDYISGGSNVEDIKKYFWDWRRHYMPNLQSNLQRGWYPFRAVNDEGMAFLGVFGHAIPMFLNSFNEDGVMDMEVSNTSGAMAESPMVNEAAPMAAPVPAMKKDAARGAALLGGIKREDESQVGMKAADASADMDYGGAQEVMVRKNFADTALWIGALETDKNGKAAVELTMPESLTTWKVNAWSMSQGTSVGYGSTEVITRKDLILRMITPRFLTEKDKCTFSAIVHNYLPAEQTVKVSGQFGSQTLNEQTVKVASNGEQRVDWTVNAVMSERTLSSAETTVLMKAVAGDESDAVEKKLPVYVHGFLKTDSYSAFIDKGTQSAMLNIDVPEDRRPEQTKFTVKFTPSLVATMYESLPALIEYPYGCVEQTLNRFVPCVIVHNIMRRENIDIKKEDRASLKEMLSDGITRLKNMQNADGGWGWFGGGHSSAHLTALAVHGLQILVNEENRRSKLTNQEEINDKVILSEMISNGRRFLQQYQAQQLELLQTADEKRKKVHADELDAFVAMVLTETEPPTAKMFEFLRRDRGQLSLYGVAMLGIAETQINQLDEAKKCVRVIEQYLTEDKENQTVYLNLRNRAGWCWWYWYGDDIETQAYYLKLLTRTNKESPLAPRLVKYLVNNRKHATYWKSTRDTAIAIEAMAEYVQSQQNTQQGEYTVDVFFDDKRAKSLSVSGRALAPAELVFNAQEISSGKHKVELKTDGTFPLYITGYLENFTLEDRIEKAGLEVKVERRLYKLERDTASTTSVAGQRGQVVDIKTEKYKRISLDEAFSSGDLIEVELIVESKNDYEYILIEDRKAAGCEPVEVRSGYASAGTMHPYIEYRDERVCFFVERLPMGKHSLTYRLRAETPGNFSALPAKIEAMYAPDLRGNSDENKVNINEQIK